MVVERINKHQELFLVEHRTSDHSTKKDMMEHLGNRPSLATARRRLHGFGTSGSSALVYFGGAPVPQQTATEEFTGETTAVNIADFTTS